MRYQIFKLLIAFLCLTSCLSLAQGALPVEPKTTLPLIEQELYGVILTYPEFPVFADFPTFYFDPIMGSRCSQPSYNLEIQNGAALKATFDVAELINQDNIDIQAMYCTAKSPIAPTPARSRSNRESSYLFAVFSLSESDTALLLSAFIEEDGHTTLGRRILSFERTLQVEYSDWEKVEEGAYSFTQTLTKNHKIMELLGEIGDPDRRWETIDHTFSFKRIFHLLTIESDEVLQVVHTLPLADYEWSFEDTEPVLVNQLEVKLNYPMTLEVIQIQQKISALQQQWLGRFQLP
ncbi:MAG: hypothetical protein AAF708_03650 [Deinococcota bacterium]